MDAPETEEKSKQRRMTESGCLEKKLEQLMKEEEVVVMTILRNLEKNDVAQPDWPASTRLVEKFKKDAPTVIKSLSGFHEPEWHLVALKMILYLLENVEPVLQPDDRIIDAVKEHVFCTIEKNLSSGLQVFEVCVQIFIILVKNYHHHLKMEVELLFSIFLNLFEKPSSSPGHKSLLVEGFKTIFADGQSVVDFYVNYDCDMKAGNIFEQLFDSLCKRAQRLGALDVGAMVHQEKLLGVESLYCLVMIISNMLEWSKRLYMRPIIDATKNSVGNSSSSILDAEEEDKIPLARELEFVKSQKRKREHGIRLFSQNRRKGLQYLQEHGLVGPEASDIAHFLFVEDRLDKKQVGEFLAGADKLHRDVLRCYLDEINLADKDLVSALRVFLKGFWLPGEAQKIDRLMELFAARYCETNVTSVFNKNTAYVTAYACIMLATSIHSPNVKEKMSKEEYVSLVQKVEHCDEISTEVLSDMYDDIQGTKIEVKTTIVATTQGSKAMMEHRGYGHPPFLHSKVPEVIKNMFQIIWAQSLATFSLVLAESEDHSVCRLCLEGLKAGIEIACTFQLTTEREAMVRALAHFTLVTASSAKKVDENCMDTIHTMILVARINGNHLGESWTEVVRCMFQLERIINDMTGILDQNQSKDIVISNGNEKASGSKSENVNIVEEPTFQSSA